MEFGVAKPAEIERRIREPAAGDRLDGVTGESLRGVIRAFVGIVARNLKFFSNPRCREPIAHLWGRAIRRLVPAFRNFFKNIAGFCCRRDQDPESGRPPVRVHHSMWKAAPVVVSRRTGSVWSSVH